MTNDKTILIDSDAFVGLLLPNDTHHVDSNRIFAYLRAEKINLLTTSAVVAETATVLSHKDGCFWQMKKGSPALCVKGS